jgi:hypothetical protein
MNRMLDLWKDIPDIIDDDSNEAAADPQSKSSARGVHFTCSVNQFTDFSFIFLFCFVLFFSFIVILFW